MIRALHELRHWMARWDIMNLPEIRLVWKTQREACRAKQSMLTDLEPPFRIDFYREVTLVGFRVRFMFEETKTTTGEA